MASFLDCLCLTRFLPLTAVNVYSLLHYPVLDNKLQRREIGHPPLPYGQAMQDRGYGLQRIPLLRTPVNRAPRASATCTIPSRTPSRPAKMSPIAPHHPLP